MTPEGTHDSITLLIGNTTPLEDIVSLLVQHGCMDLTSFIPTADAPTIAYASGGACDVYEWKLCTDTPIGLISMPVAIKTLRCSSNSNAEARLPKRAAKELYTWLQLDHPNILPLLGFAIFKGRLSMVSSWMPNGNLSSYLQRNEVSSMDRIAFCKQIREGLVYIHSKGMAHGDLKPANIMISDEGMAMISDFGNTFLKDLSLSFAPTSTFGVTYWYAAPEHLAAETPLVATKESDVYSYGLTVLEILSGEMPFKDRTHHWMIMQASRETLFPTRPSEIDDYIWSALLPCWAHDPSNRPSILDVYLSEPGGGDTVLTQLSNSQENLPLNIFEIFGGLPVPNLEGASVAPCSSVGIDQGSSWFNWNEIPQSESGMTTSFQPTGSAIGNLHTDNISLSHASSCDRTWAGYFSHTRSTGGCTTCRRRRKKCDETQPECLRCQRIGVACEGYTRFENPDRKDIMPRARPGPSKILHRSATSTSAQFNQKLSAAVPSDPFRVPKDGSKRPVVPSGTATTSNIDRFIIKDISAERDAQNNTAHDKHRTELNFSAPSDVHVSSAGPVVSNPPPPLQTIVSTDFPGGIQTVDALPTIHLAYIGLAGGLPHDFHSNAFSPNSTSAPHPYDLASVDSTGSNSQSSQNHQPLTPGQASLYYSLLSLGCPPATLPEVDPQTESTLPLALLRGPSRPSLNTGGDDEDDADEDDSETSEDDGLEDVKQAMCTTIAPDANVEANALPFVLQSYAQWINFMVFDPKNVVHIIREGVIAQFSSSQEIRTRVILLSNVFGALGKSPVLNSKVRSVVTYLSAEAHQSITCFNSTEPAYSRETDMMNALKSIDLMMEVILLRRFGGSISTIVGLVEAGSPVFRRACPEPLGQLVNLPNILLSPSINLRHYAETDIMTATLLARRMFLRYDIMYTPEINEQFMGPLAGLHWLHGIPDQFIILLAWINMLHEDFGTNVDPLLISQIEREVERVKIIPSTSDDPIYTVRRFAVQECWRLVVHIHLHVTLCGAHAEDPRVVKYVKRFMRFLGGIKPARNVDTFLSLPIIFIGSFVSRKQDRDLLFRRLCTIQECTIPGRAGHDSLMVLCDIWKRTEQEQRPAVWADLRFSCEMIAGV